LASNPCDQVRAIATYRDNSNLVADRFEAKFRYAILVADLVADLSELEFGLSRTI